MSYLYQHRFTFWNLAKLKTVKTAWFDSNEAQIDLNFELDNDPDLEDWLCSNLEIDIDTIIANGLYRLETRVPKYDDLEFADEEAQE